MIICLDLQHRGKPHGSHPFEDPGAISPAGWAEIDLTARYALAADRELRRLGHRVVILADGTYAERWARADHYGTDVYVACHADGGGGDRGTVYRDYRSAAVRGGALAGHVADALGSVLSWNVNASILHESSRGWACISGVRAVALLLEPGFVDGVRLHDTGTYLRTHYEILWASADAIGIALARGIDVWGRR